MFGLEGRCESKQPKGCFDPAGFASSTLVADCYAIGEPTTSRFQGEYSDQTELLPECLVILTVALGRPALRDILTPVHQNRTRNPQVESLVA